MAKDEQRLGSRNWGAAVMGDCGIRRAYDIRYCEKDEKDYVIMDGEISCEKWVHRHHSSNQFHP